MSWATNHNFLWREQNIYVMDNHGAAAWCWANHLSANSQHGLFHIDAHYDYSVTSCSKTLAAIPNIANISFDEYRNLRVPGKAEMPIFRWDNYLPIFKSSYEAHLANVFFATHRLGEPPADTENIEEIEVADLPRALSDLLGTCAKDGWILNLDLDYFFARQNGDYAHVFSDQYVTNVLDQIQGIHASGNVTCLTICLSPECCGGWEPAEALCYQLCDVLGIEFRLPVL